MERMTGVLIAPEKYYLFEHRLLGVLQQFQLPDLASLLQQIEIQRNPLLIESIIEMMTTHETRFFRDEAIFHALTNQIIPEWQKRTKGQSELWIWSAGCATGQEPYSVAMAIAQLHPQLTSRTQIVATDIAVKSLEKAKMGFYTHFELSRGLPENLQREYFTPNAGGATIRHDRLPKITFLHHNLVHDSPPGRFDIILCRNVSYYFSPDARKKLFCRLESAAKYGTALIVGAAESPVEYIQDYRIWEYQMVRYYELKTKTKPHPEDRENSGGA
ncbi:MAG: protein-glutamate O-methyltransferase CheR [Turneriella sp.]|nr:protein-glutamate O-methyltransferase CheR [Turneriella sp.]